ncbi:mannose/glucose-specific lectin-like [Neltuma alba]|uniref:mannose/glucose-specific lectin-like n=1 Tax=Neltuma alba TaxID=207710 RepID=UPI0010A4A07E|nr:mannose/glucose-specific lectin-like [Prosopis alba]
MAIPRSISALAFLIISFLFLQSHTVKSLSFKFRSFYSHDNAITVEGDAFASHGRLRLTKTNHGVPQPNSAGRASFSKPARLWDAKTGKLAAFSTSFSFIVSPSSSSSGVLGDGFSFFVAPFNSYLPSNSSGGFLGLFSPPTALNSHANRIVAVEFDTFGNPWDPTRSGHIGIDVNSIASVKTSSWNVEKGLTGIATISYDPSQKRLSVDVSYPENKGKRSSSRLSAYVDLRTVLPEWVRVGFSGATGEEVELHKILSWDFISSDLY